MSEAAPASEVGDSDQADGDGDSDNNSGSSSDPGSKAAADGPLGPDDFPAPDADALDAVGDADDRDVPNRLEAPPGEPLLGEPTGLGMAVGGIDQIEPFQIIALDSGEVLELPDVEGRPIGTIGTNLVMQTRSTVVALDLAAPERGTATVVEVEDGELLMTWIDREKIWTLQASSDGTFPERSIGYGVDGRQVDSLDMESGIYSFLWRSAPDLVFNSAGGIYRRSNGQVELLTEGILVAVGERTVLVHRCDDAMVCRSYWHDRRTWEPLSFAQPPGDPLVSFSVLLGDDRWLATTDLYSGGTTVAEVETGEVVQQFDASGFDRPDAGLTASPDGRWIFLPSTGDDKIIDMDSGNIWLTGLVFPSEFGRLLIDLRGTALDSSGPGA